MSETALKLLVTTLVLLWLIVTFYSSTVALIKDLCSQVRQLSHLMRCAVFAGLLLVTLYGGSKGTNTTQQSTSISLIEQVATFFSGTTAERGLDIEWDYLVNPESLPELTSNQCVSGLALVSVSTNPAPAYWAIGDLPTNMVAHVNPAWLRYGIAEDGYWINSTDGNGVKEWSYCIGGQEVESLFISSTGTISISVPVGDSASHAMPDESGRSILAPLWGPVGVVPALGSCVWSAATTNGGLLVCWNNVLIGRSTNNIASFQAELHWNGDVEFRYALPDNFITSNHVVGVQHAGGGESITLGGGNSALSVKAFSLFFRGFTPFLYGEWDLDQDGIPANEEVYLYGTSPTHFDSDFDGISDSNEVANARNPLNPDENGNGIVDGLEISFYGEYDPDDIDPRDGLSYGYKIANKLDPARDCSIDSDGDGFPDWQEELAGTDPNNGQSTPEINQGESILTDITITLGHPLPAPVMLTIGPRKIMMRAAGSWVLTLPQGVAHDISLSATQPCSLKLGAELSSDRALLLDTSGVFEVSHPAHNTSAPSMMSTTVPADAVYISGRKQCGIFARPQVKIKPPLVCFHASHSKTVEAVVTPELEGAYQWIWLNNGAVSAPAARVTNISWAGGGTADGLVISFHPTGAAWATFGSDTIYRCIHADDPEREDDDIEEHGDLWCSVHQQEYWRCALDYPGPPECDHGSTTTQYQENAGRPLAVNNDDDDGDGVLDLYDTDGVIDDNDFIKIYPFSPYTGGCCPCPSHNPSASTTATCIFCSPRLKTWGDAAKTTQCTSAGRGNAVYVEGIRASAYIGGDKIIWGWSE
ncbi:MAG: hypothetical protein PHO37_13090, partial [Kiritimatiellae bacterium]|nr:hypothetical protein [Kiritimatiellia bacterium]